MEVDRTSLRRRIQESILLLEDYFGEPRGVSDGKDLLSSLIHIILSQNTSDLNSDRAYQQLRARFPTLVLLEKARESEIATAIRSAGLYRQKSRRIKKILRWVRTEFGDLNIDGIASWPTEKVMEVLTSQEGIGIKTVAVLLLFKCGRDLFPVDTHVLRISRRLGLVPYKADAEKAFHILNPLLPPGKSYSFHVNLLRLGRQICLARTPGCSHCPLYALCPSAGKFLSSVAPVKK